MLSFVLSTGRTGTVYLTQLLNAQAGRLIAKHEPPYSRAAFVLANMFNYHGWGRKHILRFYVARRRAIGMTGVALSN